METRTRAALLAMVTGLICLSLSPEASNATSTAYPGGAWEPGPSRYGSVIVEHVPIKMDDGVVLDAAVAYPADLATRQRASGEFPVVLEDTPYVFEKIPPNEDGGPVNAYYATYGYISVRVHSRGTGASGGVGGFWSSREARDGAAVVQWAARQLDGSDGRVAFVGCSFPGGHALADAAQVGPHSPLKAVVAACIGLEAVNRHDLLVSGIPTEDVGFLYTAPERLMGANPKTTQFYRSFADEMRRGGDAAYDRDFWGQRLQMDEAKKIVDNNIPVLLWIGWRDQVGIGALRTYTAFQNAARGLPIYAPMTPNQRVTPRYQIIVGDWQHGRGLDNGIVLEWLETWVKGVDTGIQRTPTPMHLFESGTNRWVNATRYPLAAQYRAWYLSNKGILSSMAPKGDAHETLSWGEPSEPGDRLTYTSPILTKGMTIAGPISATVYASSTNTNLQIIVHLYDLAPSGAATEVTHGSMLGSLRELDPNKSWKDKSGTPIWPWQTLLRDAYLAPGQVYRLDILLEPRQWGVQAGHRLQLELTTRVPSASCPGAETRAPGNDPCYLTDAQKASVPGAQYAIQYGPTFRSQLNLPELPADLLPQTGCRITPTSRNVCLPQSWGTGSRGE